jgi:hypothetical protein
VAGSSRTTRRATTLAFLLCCGCTTIEPGSNFVVPQETFDADYFYCKVEPQLIFAKKCGPGNPSDSNSCHFNAAAVTGMALANHPAIDCGGGDHPVDTTQTGTGSNAQGNLEAVSLEMSHDYLTAALFVRPSSYNGNQPAAHPRAIFDQSDPLVNTLLRTWASK